MTDQTADRLLDAALGHVPFDGWSEATFRAATREAEVNPTVARGLFPRGAVDLAVAYHKRGDADMVRQLQQTNLDGMRFRDRVAFAVRTRIEAAGNREAVRRGTTLFSLPLYVADGTRLIWGTADAIWTALGDSSDDYNWYTKRASLSGVYSSTVLYWLGDDSPGAEATWQFLDRRIENVMQVEKIKASIRDNPVLGKLLALPEALASRIRAPRPDVGQDLPGGRTPPR